MNKKIAIVGAIVLVIAVVLVIVLGNFGGTSDTPITPDTTPPTSTEQNTPAPDTSELDKGEEQPDTSDTTPVVPEDNLQDETPSTVPEDNQQEETTPSVDTTPEVVEPIPEQTKEPTPAPEQTKEPTPTVTPKPTPEVEISGPHWVEGQAHNREDVKVGATVIKFDGTQVVLTETKVGDLIILGYGQGVDPYSGLVLANGSTAKEGTASWYDNSVWVKDNITGSMHSSAEWSEIRYATFPGRVQGSYEGEVRNTYWEWSTEMSKWLWIGPAFGN